MIQLFFQIRVRYSDIFRPFSSAPETGWSECSKTCGGGEKFKMVNVGGQMTKKVMPCNTLPCPGRAQKSLR